MNYKLKIGSLLIFLSLLFTAFNNILAQQKGNITGNVYDSSNDEPLYGANVFIENTAIGAATDLAGVQKSRAKAPLRS